MRIPTYRQKTARPRQGSGGQISARLNPSAMAAPALAFADASKQLSQAGGQIADFAYKKVLAASETEAAQANADYQIQLQNLEEELLREKDMIKAEKEFARRSKALQSNYKLSNTLGRKSFGSLAADSLTKQSLSFSRRANLKIVDQTKAASDNTVFTSVRNAADINRSDISRMADIVDIRTHLEKVSPIIGAQEATTKLRSAFAEILSGILTNKMNKSVADGQEKNPHDVIENWMAGLDTDPVVKELDTVVSDKEKAAIGKKLLSIADSIDTREARERKKKSDDEKRVAKESVAKVINVDRTNPESVRAAEKAHADNLKYRYYTSRAQRLAAEAALGATDDPSMILRPDGQGDTNTYQRLRSLANMDALSLAELNANAMLLDSKQFKELGAEADRDKAAALQSADDTIRKTFKFFTQNVIEDRNLFYLASQAYSKVSLGLGKFVREDRTAGPREIEAKVQELIAANLGDFQRVKLDLVFENIYSKYQNIRTSRGNTPFGVDEPTRQNLPEIQRQIAQVLARAPQPGQRAFREQLYELQAQIRMAQ